MSYTREQAQRLVEVADKRVADCMARAKTENPALRFAESAAAYHREVRQCAIAAIDFIDGQEGFETAFDDLDAALDIIGYDWIYSNALTVQVAA